MLLITACQKDVRLSQPANDAAVAASSSSGSNKNSENVAGHVYTLSNQVSGNAVMEYERSSDGTITFKTSYDLMWLVVNDHDYLIIKNTTQDNLTTLLKIITI